MPIFLDTSSATRKDDITFKKGEGVDTTSLSYDRQDTRWQLTKPLRGGSDAMRDDGVKWLAMEMGEKLPEYRSRLSRTHLLSAYDDTIDSLTAKPFSRDIQLVDQELLGEMLSQTAKNVDGEGGTVTTFFRASFDNATDRGITHVLVDFPTVDEELNAGEERALGVFPYFVHIDPDQLIGVKWRRKASNGVKELAQIRIKTTEVEELDEFGEQEVEFIRIINAPADISIATDEEIAKATAEDPNALKGSWEIWRLDPQKEVWSLHKEPVVHSFPGIPLLTMYFEKVADLEGRPPLWGQAELNLEHWQKKSDQDNLLHVVRIPILARFGWSEKELKKPVTVGAARSIGTTQKDASMMYIEHTGKALGSGQSDLNHIEEQMERSGLEPLMRRASSTLATNMMAGDIKETSQLQAWALLEEVFIIECFRVAGVFVSEELPDNFSADIFSEFGLSGRATENLDALDKARARGDLSRETYLSELKRYAALSSSVDIEEELARIEGEVDSGEEETEEEEETEVQTLTGSTNGHTHSVEEGARETGPGGDDNHTHPINAGKPPRTGAASNGDSHTHTLSVKEAAEAA